MNAQPRWWATVALALLSFLAGTAFGQSLSIVPKGGNEYLIEASGPPQDRYILQASPNLRLWVDLNDAVQGRFTYLLAGATNSMRFYRLAPWTEPAPPIRMVLIGDSTASDVNGWGVAMPPFFKSNAQFINYANPWTSTKVFLRSEEKDKMLLVKPDYVLVQFGLIDTVAPDLGGTTVQEYGENLRSIVRLVQGFNGTPILISPHAARAWDEQGKVRPTWQDRRAMVKAVADEFQLYYIDLNALTTVLYSELGEEGSNFMISEYVPDWMHFSPAGAKVIAKIVVGALPSYFGPYLLGEY